MGITSNNGDRAFLELYRKVAVTSNNDDTAFLKRWAGMAMNGLKICFKIDTVFESFKIDSIWKFQMGIACQFSLREELSSQKMAELGLFVVVARPDITVLVDWA